MIVQQASQRITYPLTHLDTSDDIYNGIVVADLYRWLEDDNDTATIAWTDVQHHLTSNLLESLPFREQIKDRLGKLWNTVSRLVPLKKRDQYYFQHQRKTQDQPNSVCATNARQTTL